MAIKIQGDNMQYGDTAIATLSTDALTLQSGTSLNAQKLTASNGMEITNHMTADNGVVTVSGKLTASNGLSVTGDVVCLDKTYFHGDLQLGDDMSLIFGAGKDARIEYDEDGTDELRFSGAAVTFEQAASFDANVTLGNASSDVTTVTGQLTASNGLSVNGDVSFEDASFSGDVTLGNASSDVTTVTGQLTASNGIRVDGMTNTSIFNTPVYMYKDIQLGLGGVGALDVQAESTFNYDVEFYRDVTIGGFLLGNPSVTTVNSSVTTVNGQLTASNGASISGDVLLGENDSIKAGVYITYSDATLKENIEVITNPIDKVMSMRGVTYNFKSNSNSPEVGFLAQEMKQAVPEVVYGSGDGNLGIDYAKLTSVLVEAIKTQQTQIQEQQSQIDELKECMLKNK